MQTNNTFSDWENLVKKQLKTDDIFSALSKPNLEGIAVKSLYGSGSAKMRNLPKVEESTHLVAQYSDNADENVFAFLINENVEGLEEKVIFVNSALLAGHILTDEANVYFSLVDVFNENSGEIDEILVKELLEKSFRRNICVDVALHQNSGAAIYQQLAVALSKAKELVEKYGAEILQKLIFRIAVGGNYFFEIAKIRTLKLLFNQLSKEYGLDEMPYIFAETSLRNKTKNDPENNLIRSTFELAAAMIGGVDAVFSTNYRLDMESELTQEISFKQQVVLAYESIINVFEDAANGSGFVEDITLQFAGKAWKWFLEIENSGGYSENFKNGNIQREIYGRAVEEQKWVQDGKISVVGANLFPKLQLTKSAKSLYNPAEIKPVRLSEIYE